MSHMSSVQQMRIPEIQGLRGLSILLVVLYHADFALHGGFIGVDVFFVISGFVIGRLLWTEQHQLGKISWHRFFRRRGWRILPMYALVLTSVVLWELVNSGADGARSLSRPLLHASVFATNWFFYLERSYIELDDHPLRHLWSLGVEEQFYLLMPSLLWLIVHVEKKSVVVGRWVVLVGLGAASLAASIIFVDFSFLFGVPQFILPERFAFFLPATRAWEFIVGMMLAVSAQDQRVPNDSHFGARSREALAITSFGAIGVQSFLLDSWQPFPGIRSVGVVAATAILIWASHDTKIIGRLLRFRLLTKLGDLSYGIYLLHWPLLVFAQRSLGTGLEVRISAIGLSILMAIVLHLVVEQRLTVVGRDQVRLGWLALTVFAVGPFLTSEVLGSTFGDRGRGQQAVAEVSESLTTREKLRDNGSKKCVDENVQLLTRARGECLEGSSDMSLIALLGDSHAYSVSEGVIASARRLGLGVYTWSRSGCPFMIASSANRSCNTNNELVVRNLRDVRPSVVVIANSVNHYLEGLRSESYVPRGLRIRLDQVVERYIDTIAVLTKEGFSVVVMSEVPNIARIGETTPLSHFRVRMEFNQLLERAVRNLGSEIKSRVRIVDPAQVLCPANSCTGVVKNVRIYLDSEHLNLDGALVVSSVFDRPLYELVNKSRKE